MKYWNRLQKVQRKLLREIRDGDKLWSVVVGEMKLDTKRLARWMRNRYFCRTLDDVLKLARRRTRAELKIASNIARTRLAGGLLPAAAMEPRERILFTQIISIDRRDDLLRISSQKKSSSPTSFSPIHPNFLGKSDELLAVLEGQKGVGCEQKVD